MLRQYLDLDGLVYLWSKIKANFTNVIESISVNGTRQSVIDKNVNIEIPQSMPLTDIDSTPTCNSTNLVTSGGVYSYVGTQIGTKAEDTTVVHKTGDEQINGIKCFEEIHAKCIFDSDGRVATTSDLATKLDKLTSSTDNAVVRFDGTTGNIQNSGVTINDSNHVTAAKFITSGGTSSQFVKGDGSLDCVVIPQNLHIQLTSTTSGGTTTYTSNYTYEQILASINNGGIPDLEYDGYIYRYDGIVDGPFVYFSRIDGTRVGQAREDKIIEHAFYVNTNNTWTKETRDIIVPASTSQIGLVRLSNSTSSTSQTLAATANAVRTAYNNGGVQSVNGQTGAITGLAPLASPALTGTPTAPTAASGTKTNQIATTCFVQKAVAASAGSDVNWNNDKSCLTKTLNGTTTSIVNATTIAQAGAPSIIADASCTCAQKNRRAYSARYIDSTFATIADVEGKQPLIVHFTLGESIDDTSYYATADISKSDILAALENGRIVRGEIEVYGIWNLTLCAYTAEGYLLFQWIDFRNLSSDGVEVNIKSEASDINNDQWTITLIELPSSFKTINNTSITGTGNISLPTTERVDEIEETTAAALNDLHSSLDNKLDWNNTTNTLDQSTNLPTSSAVYSAIQTAIQGIPTPMQFKGSLGTGGTYTASTLPAASSANKGWTVKVITAGTYRNVATKIGDVLVSDGSAWVLIPSGDEPSGTVTSVGLSMPTGFSVSGSPVTSSGTLAVSMTSGYGIPTTTQMTNWSNKQDAISDLQTIRSNACTGASKVSNVQSDWNATSGLAQILNKPTVISSIGYSAPAGYITANNSNAIQLAMCTSSGRKLNIGGSSWQITSTTEPSSSTDKDLIAPTWSAMASALSGKANSATTLAGYGITDAKIANGTITLGNNSITPLTSHQTLKTINNASLVGSGNITITGVCGGSGVNTAPSGGTGSQITIGGTAHYFVSTKSYCSSSDANVAPSWSAMATCLAAVRSEISGSAVTIYTGTSAPTSSTGVNGDIYIQTSCA